MSDTMLGQIIENRYRLIELLGEGARWRTFLADDSNLNRKVTIKIIQAQDDAPTVKRFGQEAAALAGLQNPHIAELYNFSVLQDGRAYLVTEWIDGSSLESVLQQVSTLKLRDALSVLRAAAQALAEAHSIGIIHRDIKPSNIIIPRGATPDEHRFSEAKLVDFSAFGQLLEQKNVTATGELFGTPLYMSPEQLRATPQSPASDIYSLGVLLYTMLFGDSPFRRQNFLESITAVVYEEITIPATIDLPANVRAFLQQCLQKDPAQRPQSGTEALKLIEELLLTTSATDVPITSINDKSANENQSHPLTLSRYRIVIIIIVLALLLVVTLVIWLSQASLVGTPPLPAQVSGIVVGIALATAGVLLGMLLRKWLARRKTEVEKDSSQVLFRTKSRNVLSESISMQVDELIARCSAIDEKILGLTIMQMLKEYESAKESNQRQTALLNTVQLLEKLMSRLSPWYVRHDKLVAFMVSATGILSGIVAIVVSIVEIIR